MTLDLKDRLYTSSEVAEILGVSLRSVYRYLEEGKLDADIKTATGRHRFSKKNILDFLQPGGISKDQAEDRLSNNSYDDQDDEFNVLDLPAISKAKKSDETYDDFNFELDEDFFKSLSFDSNQENKNDDVTKQDSNSSKLQKGEFVDDDLERLLREFEEKEGLLDEALPDLNPNFDIATPKQQNNFDNDDDFDLDSFFNELIEESSKNTVSQETKNEITQPATKNLENDGDFDFDFDLSFFDELESDKNQSSSQSASTNTPQKVSSVDNSSRLQAEDEDSDSEDNWLERFRKAAQKNSSTSSASNENKDTLKDSFFDSSNLDKFFGSDSSTSAATTSILSSDLDEVEESKFTKNAEYYYASSLNGLKEIAQNVDKIAKKFDTDYAFTLNAGLSLHKPISPFTLIHTYVRGRDLELFEDYLNLTPVDSSSEASVCLIVPSDTSVFEDSYELHGLYVVSNVQLRSDLIDKGMDKLAREI